MKNSLVVLSLVALTVACAPVGSKSVQFTSGAAEDSLTATSAADKAKALAADKEAAFGTVSLVGERAMTIFMNLRVAQTSEKNPKGNPINVKQGTDIKCEETVPQKKGEDSSYSCAFDIYADGTVGYAPAAPKVEAPANNAPAAVAPAPVAPAPETPASVTPPSGVNELHNP